MIDVSDSRCYHRLSATMETMVEGQQFLTTRWSIVLRAKGRPDDSQIGEARAALSDLCRIYWRPTYAFICRRGYSASDAQDITQDFFVAIIESKFLGSVDPALGRFRSILCAWLKHFLSDEADRRKSQKRGGNREFVPWDEWMSEAPSHASVSPAMLDRLNPQEIFDLRWATTVVEQALRRLRDECAARGRVQVFEVLSPWLSAERGDFSYEQAAASLGLPVTTLKALLHRLRQRYRFFLRDEVQQTVLGKEEVEDEIRYLCAVLAKASPV